MLATLIHTEARRVAGLLRRLGDGGRPTTRQGQHDTRAARRWRLAAEGEANNGFKGEQGPARDHDSSKTLLV